jgi:peptide/nickel transport system substrate-binding protein
MKLISSPEVGADLLFFNLQRPDTHPIVQDVRVRRAIAYAVDSNAIAARLWSGLASTRAGLVPRAVLGAPSVLGLGHDALKADAMLDAAGWVRGPDGVRVKDGVRLRLQVTLGDITDAPAVAPLLVTQLAQVGIEAEVSLPDIDHFFNHDLGGGDYDIAGLGFIGQRDANPLGMLSYLSPVPGGCNFCIFAYVGTGFDAGFARAVAAGEQDARAEAANLAATALRDDAALIVLDEKPFLIGLRDPVQDVVAQPRDQDFEAVWLAA